MRLLALADGYGDVDSVPVWYPKYHKWPDIIKMMTRGVDLNNCSRYGAGNEFMVNQLKQNIDSADMVMIQWAQPNRLDLLLAHNKPDYWTDVIASDAVYNTNVVACGSNKFWLSSNSLTPDILDYHNRYISLAQHQSRSQIFVEYAKLLLEQRGIDYRFMLVADSEYLDVDAKWIWHEPLKGMINFKSKSNYQHLNLNTVHPLPLVAFDFIKQFVMPSVDLQWRNAREIDAVENMLYRIYQEAVKNRNDSN